MLGASAVLGLASHGILNRKFDRVRRCPRTRRSCGKKHVGAWKRVATVGVESKA